MGIPGFYKQWLLTNTHNVIESRTPKFVSSLSFDLNAVFHDAFNKIFNIENPTFQSISKLSLEQLEIEFFEQVRNIILNVVKLVNPEYCLILAVDGVVPVAKLQQQKRRRERSAKERSITNPFDRNNITPGTNFMIRLDNYISKFIVSNRNLLPPKVIYSSHLVPNEGEQKIMEYFRRGDIIDENNPRGDHVIYGLDADLIMLSLLSPIDNIYLLRESTNEIININNFRKYLKQRLRSDSAVNDFVVMMFLIGNDFLPNIPSLTRISESINVLLDVYSSGKYKLTNKDEINWEGMKEFITEVQKLEVERLKTLASQNLKGYLSTILHKSFKEQEFNFNIFRTLWYQNELNPKGSKEIINAVSEIINQDKEPKIQNLYEVNQDKIYDMVISYIQMISWTYLYYYKGTDFINYELFYHYYHAPTLLDLKYVIDNIQTSQIVGYKTFRREFNVLHQLVSVMPVKSKNLIPLELQTLFNYDSPIRDMFPNNFIIEQGERDYEGLPIIPFIDIDRVIDAVASVSIDEERAKIWSSTDHKIFIDNSRIKPFRMSRARPEYKQIEIPSRSRTFQYQPKMIPSRESTYKTTQRFKQPYRLERAPSRTFREQERFYRVKPVHYEVVKPKISIRPKGVPVKPQSVSQTSGKQISELKGTTKESEQLYRFKPKHEIVKPKISGVPKFSIPVRSERDVSQISGEQISEAPELKDIKESEQTKIKEQTEKSYRPKPIHEIAKLTEPEKVPEFIFSIPPFDTPIILGPGGVMISKPQSGDISQTSGEQQIPEASKLKDIKESEQPKLGFEFKPPEIEKSQPTESTQKLFTFGLKTSDVTASPKSSRRRRIQTAKTRSSLEEKLESL